MLGTEDKDRKKLEALLPGVKYVKKWEYSRDVRVNSEGIAHKSLTMKVIVDIPDTFKKWEEFRMLLIGNGVTISNQKSGEFFGEYVTFSDNYSDKTVNLPWKRKYSLETKITGVFNEHERITALVEFKNYPRDEEFIWDLGIVKAIGEYVRLYEESKKPKAKEEAKAVEAKPAENKPTVEYQ
jgi:hypothetical protein